MNNMIYKKFISLILTFSLIVGIFGGYASVIIHMSENIVYGDEDTYTYQDEYAQYDYIIDNSGNANIIKCYDNTGTTIKVPSEVDGYTVTAITVSSLSENAFEITDVESIELPDTIRKLGDYTFYNVPVKSIKLPSNLTTIGNKCFSLSKIESIEMPSTVTRIGFSICQYCSSLKSVILSEELESITESAFVGCTALTEIEIPEKVTDIEYNAFLGCTNLRKISLPISLKYISNQGNIFFGCENLTTIDFDGNDVYDERNNCKAIIEVETGRIVAACPSTVIPNTAKIIGKNSFAGCYGREEIYIPKNITTIEDMAFVSSKDLKKVIIASGTNEIRNGVFSSCNSLTTIVIPSSVTSIGSLVFNGVDTSKLVIKGTIGSFAEEYANDNNITFEALKSSYNVNFESNTDDSIDSQTVAFAGRVVEPEVPTKEGYKFAGWYTDEACTQIYNFKSYVTDDFTLYAGWNINLYNVFYEENGGDPYEDQIVSYGGIATKGEATRTGHTFKGWYSDSNLTSLYDFDTSVKNDLTLYASWSVNKYSINFESNGGSYVPSQKVYYQKTFTEPDPPTKEGCVFKGWYADDECTKAYDFSTKVTKSIKVYASWEYDEYTVTFIEAGGDAVEDQKVIGGQKAVNVTPNRTGYIFKGWYTESSIKNLFDFNTPITSNITLYAGWNIKQYIVKFDTNGGSEIPSQVVNYGEKITKPDNPTKANSIFINWYLDEDFTKEFSFDNKIKGNHTLYAKWETIDISYRTHVQTYGWQDLVMNGTLSGTTGEAKRLEGIKIMVQGNDNLGIQYTTHCQTYGWLPWSANGEMNGTEGEAKRLEAIKIQLTGTRAEKYDVYYRVHAQSYGWLSWAKNGEASGTAGYAKRLEGIQIVIVEKGSQAPDNNYQGISSEYEIPYIFRTGNRNPSVDGEDETNVVYRCNVQSIGWQGWKYNGDKGGTSGQALRLEGLKIRLTNKQYQGGIRYRAQVQSVGWQAYVSNGATSGVLGKSKRLEAFQAELTGDLAEYYDLYYRTHVQNYGWLDWAKNGETSGTVGLSKRIEALEMKLVKKTEAAPGETTRTCIKR